MALALAEAGADLVICGRRRAMLDESAGAIRAVGREVTVIPADVTRDADLQTLREGAGRIDILVNNAGTTLDKPWTEVSIEEWRGVMTLNLEAPFRLCQIFVPGMVERRWGRVINNASVYAGLGPDPSRYPGTNWDVLPYFASKHGLQGLTHYLATRLAPFGVCVNSLSPGMFPSERIEDLLTPAVREALIDGTPMHRLGEIDDLKAAIVFLASPGAKFVTGQNLIVDGGWTVW
jgi:NAD(P)-dependent dehydrogenase (short-subunit alcohol dehydrogenase family)